MAAPAEEKYTCERLLSVHRWTETLLSFRMSRAEGFRFTPGQFARLGLRSGQGFVWRAYSMVNAVWDDELEFLSIVVPNGEFTSRLVRLSPGDEILLDKRANGFFTADRFVDGRDLWLLGTGTGLAPYMSILREPEVWARFETLTLVHSVRTAAELAYRDEIDALRAHPLWAEHGHKLCYQPVVTREFLPGSLHERLPELLENGMLEQATGRLLSPEHSRIMICGNPQMVEDTHRQLTRMGYRLSRLSAPGQLVLENGF